MADEAGLAVDRGAFDELMTAQRTRAKADAKSKKKVLADLSVYGDFRAKGETIFTGYTDLTTESTVLGLLVDGRPVPVAVAGQTAEVILAETSLYAESGGQAPDQGRIVGDGYELEVLDVQKPVKGLISHTVKVVSGEVGVGVPATTLVDEDYRRGATQAHSGTHLVHAALRQVLGPNAHQSGSFNKAGYLRLDYGWNSALSPETRSEIEEISNNAIRDNLQVVTREMPLDEAKALGAMALFGEKYGDVVRVVDIGGPWSRELCAGTHVSTSAEVGMINIVGESSVGASNRRVESLVGMDAFRRFAAERALVSELSTSLKTRPEQLVDRVGELVTSLKSAEKRIAQFEARALADRVPALAANADAGRRRAARRRDRRHARFGRRTAVARDRRALEARRRGIRGGPRGRRSAASRSRSSRRRPPPATRERTRAHSRRRWPRVLGGGGGGKPDLAQGGGSDVSAIPAALDAVRRELDR